MQTASNTHQFDTESTSVGQVDRNLFLRQSPASRRIDPVITSHHEEAIKSGYAFHPIGHDPLFGVDPINSWRIATGMLSEDFARKVWKVKSPGLLHYEDLPSAFPLLEGESDVDASTLNAIRDHMLSELDDIEEYAIYDNWDGEGADALSKGAIDKARTLVDLFPNCIETLEAPVVSATPHGEVDFDWSVARDKMLTVSIEAPGNIVFAGVFGEVKASGRYKWTGELPRFIECCVVNLL